MAVYYETGRRTHCPAPTESWYKSLVPWRKLRYRYHRLPSVLVPDLPRHYSTLVLPESTSGSSRIRSGQLVPPVFVVLSPPSPHSQIASYILAVCKPLEYDTRFVSLLSVSGTGVPPVSTIPSVRIHDRRYLPPW